MGIPLQAGAADAAVQPLAVKAQNGDKQAQYELGRWFEDSADPNGLKKAVKLYRIAATPRGGMRLMHIPGSSGVTTSVISTGPRIEPNRAAQKRLRVLGFLGDNDNQKYPNANKVSLNLSQDTVLSKNELEQESIPESIITDLIKLDYFSDRCLRLAGGSATPKNYVDTGWSCIIKSSLPLDCSSYGDTILKVARLALSHPNFRILQDQSTGLVKRCVTVVPTEKGLRSSVQPVAATLLDFMLREAGVANSDERRRLTEYEESDSSHSNFSWHPGEYFPNMMCKRLFSGQPIARPNAWIIVCTTDFGPHWGNGLSEIITERGHK